MTTAVPGPIGVVAHYNLLERLEPAGPGELYRARDTKLGRTVAVRLLPTGFAAEAAEREALLEKARSVIALSHPNVTTLFDAGEHDGRLYLAFEFLKGQSLRGEMAGRPMNVRRAVELAIQMADAVADAHAAGFVHGGLSPDSIVITAKGHAKIPAFELAARAGFESGAASSGDEVRLRDYDSPEEARGNPSDERSDIYSVGAVLYEMLTTRRPLHRGASAPGASNAHVPAELDDIVLRAVAPNPDSRFQSAAAFAAEMRAIAAILDVRGGAGDEEDEEAGPPTTVGRVLVTTVVILGALGVLMWLFLRT
jgi:serine/threonine-protein kinase